MITKIFRKIHKVLGLLLSLLFLMWFLSGIVMIYHSFPRVSQKMRLARQASLGGSLSPVDSLFGILPDSARVAALSVEMYIDRPVFHLQGKQLPAEVYADSLRPLGIPAFGELAAIATRLCGTAPSCVDTLNKLDQWIPFGYLTREFPIYKFHFSDAAGQEIYFSSKTGKILQWTDRRARFWAWLGAIPHWVYFTSLRQNQELWNRFMVWASALGTVMCFSGLWVGIWAFRKNRRKGLHSPYRQWWWRWHHITGTVFGLFALTFVFSGMMSLVSLPSWMQKGRRQKEETRFRGRDGGMLPVDTYLLDYRHIVSSMHDVKSIEWTSFGEHPYYAVNTSCGKICIDASDSTGLVPFRLTEPMIHEAVHRMHGSEVPYSVEWLTDWDNDYYSRRGMLTLPVYKVVLQDEVHTHHYFNPETLYHRRIDDNSRLRGLLYGGFHSLNFRFLAERPLLWNMLMYTLLLGGTFLSLSGVVMTFGWLRRMWRRWMKRKPMNIY
ncbi:MAG: PepSY domain-containing protein [Odoribacter sp.]|nr:PepSY domain-containing protein [Odoribacter sp.]